MSPLARLLVRKQDNGLSFREMERKALAKGFRYSSSAFEQVAKDGRAGRLDIDAIKAIAAGIDEDVATIARLDDERWGILHADEVDDFRYQRPAGLSDAEWDRVRAENRSHMDYLVERAAKER
jgi:hypothetical protein